MNKEISKNITIINNLTLKSYNSTDYDNIIFNNKLSTITVEIADTTIFQNYDTNILWNFGDGHTEYGKSVTHYYEKPGNYYISCILFEKDGTPVKNIKNINIQVISALDTTLTFTNSFISDIDTKFSNIRAGEIFNAGEFIVKLDKDIKKEVPITCNYENSNSIKSDNLIDIYNKDQYVHLLPYHSFFNKENEPINSILPQYLNVYMTVEYGEKGYVNFVTDGGLKADKVSKIKSDLDLVTNGGTYNDATTTFGSNLKFQSENEIIQTRINFYILNDKNLDNEIISKIGQIKTEHIKNFEDLIYKTIYISDISEIPEDFEKIYIGRIGYAQVDFEEDIPNDNEEDDTNKLIYNLDTDYFEDDNINLAKDTLNLVPIGLDITIKANTFSNALDIVYSTNGLFTNYNIANILSIDENKFSVDRAKFININSQVVFRIRSYNSSSNHYYFPKDLLLELDDSLTINPEISINNNLLSAEVDLINESYSVYGSLIFSIKPKIEGKENYINFKFSQFADLVKLSNLTYIDFNSFSDKNSEYYLDPKQNYQDFSTEEIWKVHKVHPSLADVPNLDKFMLAIFGQHKFIEKTINKGFNFVDDVANINTTTIKNLISLLDSIGIDTELYNNENFNHPHVLSDLMKLFSINHSRLIGTEVVQNDVFSENGFTGKNLGEKIEISDKIYINKDEEEKEIYPYIIIYDKFARTYRKVSSRSLTVVTDSPFETEGEGSLAKKYFKLSSYRPKWGWNLLLRQSEYTTEINSQNIPKYYDFYFYKEDVTKIVENSYLKPETINTNNIKDYETWTKKDGSIERLLYKTLIETIGLDDDDNELN